ncbi:hypothetical protein VNI00_013449 [Paramarasmius palmivorus]|uniref:F-box domain-containing protein n=1 Tax=Paramarasmius palmivorus TaxID=297713 RepID=A0AAW0C2A9_9AGAR
MHAAPSTCESCNALISDTTLSIPPHALRSDYVPTETEVAQTHLSIKEELRMLKEYDERISWHRNFVDKLEIYKNMVEKRLERRRATISGLRRLPVEVLDLIFSLVCSPIRDDECSGTTQSPFHMPTKGPIRVAAHDLSLTCAAWRQIVVSRPRLWASISLDLRYRGTTDIRPLLQASLTNSAKTPLKISFYDTGSWRWERPVSVPAYLASLTASIVGAYRMLFQEMSRCAVLQLSLPWEALAPHVTGTSDVAFPQLRTFLYDIGEYDPQSTPAWFWQAAFASPNLAFLRASIQFGLLPHTPPYNQLTTLVLEKVKSVDHLRTALASSPNLEVPSLENLSDWELPGNAVAHMLPSLKYLRISCAWPIEDWFATFAPIRVPLLKGLSILNNLDDRSPRRCNFKLPMSFTSTLQRCGDTLQHLIIHISPVSYHESEITDLVKSLPNLAHLQFMTYAYNAGISPCISHLFSHLADLSRPMAMKLKSLDIRELNFCLGFHEELVEAVLSLAESRSKRTISTSGHVQDFVPVSSIRLYWTASCYDHKECLERKVDFEASAITRARSLLQDGTACTITQKTPKWLYNCDADFPLY